MEFQPISAFGAVQSYGDELPVRHNTMVQANAGVGEYNAAAYPMAPRPFSGSPDGIGAYAYRSGTLGLGAAVGSMFGGSPLLRGMKLISNRRKPGMAGLGADAPADSTIAPSIEAASGVLVAAVALGMVVTGISGYYVGKAVAPRGEEGSYAWWGVAAALLLGPLGLGIEAGVALHHK